MDFLIEPAFWASLLTLTFLEIVLGIDNVIFISIASSRIAQHRRAKIRTIGLWIACALRVLMLMGLVWVSKLSFVLFQIPQWLQNMLGGNVLHEEMLSFTAQDGLLVLGGLFLLAKGTWEIHESLEGEEKPSSDSQSVQNTVLNVLLQIIVINFVFSLDSVITAVGMTDNILVMLLALLFSTVLMMFSVHPVSKFIERHPTTKLLALSFILLIGVALIADGLGVHIPRGYLYFAIAFSLFVETLNIVARQRKLSNKRVRDA